MADNVHPEPGLVLDGYTFIRPLGQGGFGTVWLVSSGATGGYHALKWIAGSALEHEWSAVRIFREVSQRLRSPHLIAVEHVNRTDDALYYTLPLADGGPGNDPADADWCPVTLGDLIEQKRGQGAWFSSDEVLRLFLPVARVAVDLNENGLVHRDIKPANILFFGGQPCLADIGLLGTDRASLSMRGTPGHIPPSWYEGEPDMWGLATTLFVMLTANPPDRIGRVNFRWPPGGEEALSEGERGEWLRLHRAILRATEENPAERFIGLGPFVDAVAEETASPPPLPPRKPAHGLNRSVRALLALLVIVLGWIGYQSTYKAWTSQKNSPSPPEVADLPSQEIADLRAKVDQMSKERDAEQAAKRDANEKYRQRSLEITRQMKADMAELNSRHAELAADLRENSKEIERTFRENERLQYRIKNPEDDNTRKTATPPPTPHSESKAGQIEAKENRENTP